MTAPSPRPAGTEVTHACPEGTSAVTGCCGRTPFELPRTDRLATNPAWVTCPPAAPDTTGELREAAEQFWHDLINEDDQGAVDKLIALLAERDTLAAKVQAGLALADRYRRLDATDVAAAIRRALGTPTTGTA